MCNQYYRCNSKVILCLQVLFLTVSTCKSFAQENSYENNCKVMIGERIFDFKKLYRRQGYLIENGTKKIYLNICGAAVQCGASQISICEIDEHGKKIILGLFYEYSFRTIKNQPTLRYKTAVRKEESLITFKCNRRILAPVIHYNGSIGRKHKFTLETPLICNHQPAECLIRGMKNDLYDLKSLYKPNGNWIVANVSKDFKIFLNLCGDLHLDNIQDSECSYKGTQACLVDKHKNTWNLGAFSSKIIQNENSLTLHLSDGSKCTYGSMYTQIDFVCSFTDSGPILGSNSSCEYKIIWNTPAACPHYISVNENCIVDDPLLLGLRNFSILNIANQQRKVQLNEFIKYSICSDELITCNGRRDVIVCFISYEKEILFGANSRRIISKDGLLEMHTTGEICQRNAEKYNSALITFRCDYTLNKQINIMFSEDLCSVNFTIFTNQACPVPYIKHTECSTPVDSQTGEYFDLSPLTLKHSNYELTDMNNENITYIINICQPIVFNENSICNTAAICLRNESQPNKLIRFLNLGDYITSKLTLYTNFLTLEFDGRICEGDRNIYKTIIKFICSENSKLTLKSKSTCVYNFIWETKYACALQIKNNNESGQNEDDLMEHYSSKGTENISYIEKHLSSVEEKTISDNKSEKSNITLIVPNEVSNVTGIFIKNCTLMVHNQNTMNLSSLPKAINITSYKGRMYSLHVCCCSEIENRGTLLTSISLNYDQRFVEMNLRSLVKCNSDFYKSILLLKCSEQSHDPQVLKEEECSAEIEWRNSIACSFLPTVLSRKNITSQQSEHFENSTSIVIPVISVVAFLLCLLSLFICYLWRKRRFQVLGTRKCEYNKIKDTAKIS